MEEQQKELDGKWLQEGVQRMMVMLESDSRNESFARVAVAAFLSQLNPTLEEVADVKTALSEAVTNCVVHAYEGKVEKILVECMIKGQELTVLVEDRGCGIADVHQAMEPLFTTKPDSERCGMGFAFMEAFMDSLEVESSPGKGTRVTMKKKIGRTMNKFEQ